MTHSHDRGPDQGDADRHRQLHRLPGVPGGLQAVERARRRGDRAGGRTGLPEPGDAQREDVHAHRVPRDGEPGEAGRRGIRLRDAAVPPLPGAGLRLRLPDDGALPADRRSGVVRRRRLHRLPLLHAGVSLGRADRGMELARPEDLEVHALRRPRRSAGAGRVQRAAAVRRRGQAVRRHHRDSRLRQGVPRRRPALRNPGRDAGARAQAHRRPARQVRRPRLRREGAGRDERAVPVGRAVRETRLSDVRGEALSGLHQDGARRRAPRRDGRGRPARRRVRLLPEAGSGGGRRIGCVEAFRRPRPRRIRASPEHAADPVQLGPPAAHGVRRRLVGRALRPGARRQHQPLRHLPVGPVDPLRPGVDRGGRGRVRDGRRDLCLPAQGSLRAGPHRRPDGPPELLLRDGHSPRRPRPALALLRARPAGAGALGHVRGLVVRRPLRHDPPARIPAGALRALGIPAGRGGAGGDGTAPTWRRR